MPLGLTFRKGSKFKIVVGEKVMDVKISSFAATTTKNPKVVLTFNGPSDMIILRNNNTSVNKSKPKSDD